MKTWLDRTTFACGIVLTVMTIWYTNKLSDDNRLLQHRLAESTTLLNRCVDSAARLQTRVEQHLKTAHGEDLR